MKFQTQFLYVLLLNLASCGPNDSFNSSNVSTERSREDSRALTKKTVERAQENLMNLQIDQKLWDMPSYLGMHYTAQYYLFLQWSGRQKESTLDVNRLKKQLLNKQLPTGGWMTVRDHLKDIGDINASIMNYAALKAMGVSIESHELVKAREWIINAGGVEASSTFTKAFLALFGQHNWDVIPKVPFVIFDEKGVIYPGKIFAQWIGPHVFPLAYLRHFQVSRHLGERFDLSEIRKDKNAFKIQNHIRVQEPTEETILHVKRMLNQQRSKGSFGAYTLATLFSMMVLDDYRKNWPTRSGFIGENVDKRAMEFLESLYVNNATKNYEGVVDDGHLWDTVLVLDALLTSGMNPKDLEQSAAYLASRQVANGGLPFGNDFEPNPDTDDTAVALSVWGRYPQHQQNVVNGIKFILSMQNRDGGVGAFSRNNIPIPLIEGLVGKLKDSADLYDESSADIVGHTMEGIGRGYAKTTDSASVKKMMSFLGSSRDPELKAWTARWGINYLYGTSSVITGMHALGFPSDHEYIGEGLKFIAARQNADGGFGETAASDFSKKLAGKGPSSPTQTGLGLLALLADRERYQVQIDKAVDYLNQEFEKHGKWVDPHAIGIGHPKIIYMEYPSYPYAFPLKALGVYLNDSQ